MLKMTNPYGWEMPAHSWLCAKSRSQLKSEYLLTMSIYQLHLLDLNYVFINVITIMIQPNDKLAYLEVTQESNTGCNQQIPNMLSEQEQK